MFVTLKYWKTIITEAQTEIYVVHPIFLYTLVGPLSINNKLKERQKCPRSDLFLVSISKLPLHQPCMSEMLWAFLFVVLARLSLD
jgi:hypothetical protein